MIIWLIYISLEVLAHYYLIEVKKSRPDYLRFNILRGMASIFHGAYMDVSSWAEYGELLLFQVTSFWILFDVALNLARGKHFLYWGKKSGWIDSKIGGSLLYYVLKFICAVVFIVMIWDKL